MAEGRSVADVFHSALAEYFEQHRERLTAIYDDTRAALAAGDLDRLTAGFREGQQQRVDEMMLADPAEMAAPRPDNG